MRPSCLIQMCNIAFGFAGWHAKCSVMPFIEDVLSLPFSSSGRRTKARTLHILRTRCTFLWLSLGPKTTWIRFHTGCELWTPGWRSCVWPSTQPRPSHLLARFSFETLVRMVCVSFPKLMRTALNCCLPDPSTNCVRFPYRWTSVVDLTKSLQPGSKTSWKAFPRTTRQCPSAWNKMSSHSGNVWLSTYFWPQSILIIYFKNLKTQNARNQVRPVT